MGKKSEKVHTHTHTHTLTHMGLPQWLNSKESACNVGDLGLILGLGKSPEEEHGNPLQYFFFPFIFISWRLITLQYCSGFCHTLA